MTASDARLHLRYSTWASKKVLEAASALKPDDLDRTVGVSHGSIVGTLTHIQYADWIWYTRVSGASMEKPGGTFADVQNSWPALLAKWEAWSDALTDADLLRMIDYKSALDGKSYSTPVWQIVMHVVNHATLHRGQAVGMIRQLGIAPPATDLIFYYRELEAKGATA
jgi:uncharacterized damage-inducible protein DinB